MEEREVKTIKSIKKNKFKLKALECPDCKTALKVLSNTKEALYCPSCKKSFFIEKIIGEEKDSKRKAIDKISSERKMIEELRTGEIVNAVPINKNAINLIDGTREVRNIVDVKKKKMSKAMESFIISLIGLGFSTICSILFPILRDWETRSQINYLLAFLDALGVMGGLSMSGAFLFGFEEGALWKLFEKDEEEEEVTLDDDVNNYEDDDNYSPEKLATNMAMANMWHEAAKMTDNPQAKSAAESMEQIIRINSGLHM